MKPAWLKKSLRTTGILPMQRHLRGLALHTVCEEAQCPNLPECFSKNVATIMIMGDVCTRSCRFCAVATGRPASLDPAEPHKVALWAKELSLKHLVITSVDRDDLADLGATHFAETVREVKNQNRDIIVEVLTPDFQGRGDLIRLVCKEGPQIYNHNLETVERLTPHVRSASKYRRSLSVIHWVKDHYPRQTTKSGLMLGLGETGEEVIQAMRDLVEVGCDMLTLGQYLQPTPKHLPVQEYIHPQRFAEYEQMGKDLGFKAVFAGPFVRSSYLADEIYGRLSLRA